MSILMSLRKALFLKPDNPQVATIAFDCPKWPRCNCPDGTMRPDCPGLRSLEGQR